MISRRFIRTAAQVAAMLMLATLGSGAAWAKARAAAPLATMPGPSKYESWLNAQVRHKLLTLPWYGVFDNLEYRTQGHEVILMGQVVRPVTKSDAASAVKGIEGVQRVVNRIEVLPPSPLDNQIRRAEYRAIFRKGSPLFRYSMGTNPGIHIIVNTGHVTLEGVVDSAADRDMAVIRARQVPNVFSVTSHLRIA